MDRVRGGAMEVPRVAFKVSVGQCRACVGEWRPGSGIVSRMQGPQSRNLGQKSFAMASLLDILCQCMLACTYGMEVLAASRPGHALSL